MQAVTHQLKQKGSFKSLFEESVSREESYYKLAHLKQIPGKKPEFTGQDYRNILELFISNEQVLTLVYELLFPASKTYATHPPLLVKRQSRSTTRLEQIKAKPSAFNISLNVSLQKYDHYGTISK